MNGQSAKTESDTPFAVHAEGGGTQRARVRRLTISPSVEISIDGRTWSDKAINIEVRSRYCRSNFQEAPSMLWDVRKLKEEKTEPLPCAAVASRNIARSRRHGKFACERGREIHIYTCGSNIRHETKVSPVVCPIPYRSTSSQQ